MSAGAINTDTLIEAVVALHEARSVIGQSRDSHDADLLRRLAKAEAGLRSGLMSALPNLRLGAV